MNKDVTKMLESLIEKKVEEKLQEMLMKHGMKALLEKTIKDMAFEDETLIQENRTPEANRMVKNLNASRKYRKEPNMPRSTFTEKRQTPKKVVSQPKGGRIDLGFLKDIVDT